MQIPFSGYLSNILGEGVVEGLNSILHTASLLVADVGLRVLSLTDQNHSKTGGLSGLFEHLGGFGEAFGMDILSNLLSVNNLVSHDDTTIYFSHLSNPAVSPGRNALGRNALNLGWEYLDIMRIITGDETGLIKQVLIENKRIV